jgi:hypothetical protein
LKTAVQLNVWKFGGKIKLCNVYKLIYFAKYSKVAGNKSNKTSIIFDRIGFKEYYKPKIP